MAKKKQKEQEEEEVTVTREDLYEMYRIALLFQQSHYYNNATSDTEFERYHNLLNKLSKILS